jgi:hypothetical protein
MDSLKELQRVPGVGKKLSKDLLDLGYHSLEELQGENPEEMYEKLSALRGRHIDRCVLYVFRTAVYFAENSIHEPKLLKWWNWTDKSSK